MKKNQSTSKSTYYKIAFAFAFCFLVLVIIIKTLIDFNYNQINISPRMDKRFTKGTGFQSFSRINKRVDWSQIAFSFGLSIITGVATGATYLSGMFCSTLLKYLVQWPQLAYLLKVVLPVFWLQE